MQRSRHLFHFWTCHICVLWEEMHDYYYITSVRQSGNLPSACVPKETNVRRVLAMFCIISAWSLFDFFYVQGSLPFVIYNFTYNYIFNLVTLVSFRNVYFSWNCTFVGGSHVLAACAVLWPLYTSLLCGFVAYGYWCSWCYANGLNKSCLHLYGFLMKTFKIMRRSTVLQCILYTQSTLRQNLIQIRKFTRWDRTQLQPCHSSGS